MNRRAVEIRVGLGSCGIASGGEAVRDALEREGAVVKAVGCNGMCHREPIVEVVEPGGRRTLYGNVDAPAARLIARRLVGQDSSPAAGLQTRPAFLQKQQRIVLENCGEIDPLNIDDYLARDGYRALERCAKELSPEQLIAAISASGLRGRGGAGFPTGRNGSARGRRPTP